MAVLSCKMCGAPLPLTPGVTVTTCDFCGREQTIPSMDNEKKLTLFARAERLRTACEFDKAAGVFESIVAEYPQEAEAYWGLVLCKYGIEYVDDPATGEKIPTCHRSSFDSVFDDPDYEQVYDNADVVSRKVYRTEAKRIEDIRRSVVAVSNNEVPYDIFICYKETAENGDRTLDSVLAQDIYDALTAKGYRVFFARITLEDKLGQEYEPYIFAALNSAKIMLAVGTDFEYYNAVWVKNEWSRYLKLMAKDKGKHLIPCFKGLDAYDMPKEFAKLQAQDLGKVGAMQDLLRGIEKILPRQKEVTKEIVKEQVVVQQTVNTLTAPLLQRAFIFLEDGKWNDANTYCEKVLDLEPENAQAYLGKLMAEQKVKKQEQLRDCAEPFDHSDNYQKACRFGDEASKRLLTNAVEHIKERNRLALWEKTYTGACAIYKHAQNSCGKPGVDLATECVKAIEDFTKILKYKDATEMVDKCRELAYNHALALMRNASTEEQFRFAAEQFLLIPGYQSYKDAVALHQECMIKAEDARYIPIYNRGLALMKVASSEEQWSQASALFSDIPNFRKYRDAETLYFECLKKATEVRYEEIYKSARRNQEKGDRDSLARAAYEFNKIGDYKDSRERAQKCSKIVEEIKEYEEKQKTEKKKALERRREGICQHCGGEFKGLFTKKCSLCGKSKDY